MGHPQVGNQSLFLFIACTEVNSFLCPKYFLKKYEEFMFLVLILAYSLIKNEFLGNRSYRDNLETLRNKKRVRNLETETAHANKQKLYTRNTSSVATNSMKSENVLHM